MLNEQSSFTVILLILIGCMNVLSCSLYYIDKQRAINRKYRIPEKTLLISSYALGGIGAWLGMKLFRHKTKHVLFKISLPVAAVLTILVIFYLVK